jgi:ferrous iron transport protein B
MSHDCGSCALNPHRSEVVAGGYDFVVAVAGNPNTGKSTVFNALTGLRQRSGNWPGTTVTRAEGVYRHQGIGYNVVDLPGVYSLRSATGEEDVAREFLENGAPDVTVVVVDATRLERNLALVLQILQVTDRVVVALNLIDEAERHGITVDTRHLARELGVPVTATAARRGQGIPDLLESIDLVARGRVAPRRRQLRLDGLLEDDAVAALFAESGRIARSSITGGGQARLTVDRLLDRALTHRVWGFVVMGLLFFGVFWFTITGAAVPSDLLYRLLVQDGHALVRELLGGAPWWVTGLVADGIYLGTAWVIAVMLPPMAIFFPLFTLLEDFGYLPRVAFNLDRLFAAAGAHGKQSLSMMMGYGCNAAGVTATRIIDSPRERMIAIVTNNFSICNGRWPTLILMGTVFIRGPRRGRQRRTGRRTRNRHHPDRLVGPVEDRPARCDVGVLAGTSAVPATAGPADDLHQRRRPHPEGPLSRGRDGRTGRRGHLADRQRHHRRRDHRRSSRPRPRSAGPRTRSERHHPAGVRRRDPRQRDHHPHHPDADVDARPSSVRRLERRDAGTR